MTLKSFCRIAFVFVAVLAVSAAPPPAGFYTFDGRKLHPIGRPVQRRSGNEPNFVSGWKLPEFKKPSFLAALTEKLENNDDDDEPEEGALPTVLDSHLLPDYLTHQEFLKPQLQAAGFSGGRIIAGPFPVPLAALPKTPQTRSGSNGHVASSTVVLAPPPSPPLAVKQAPTAAAPVRPYKPVQFPAVASQPISIGKKPINSQPPPLSPPPPPITTTTTTPKPITLQTSKLTYPLPPPSAAASAPAPWYAAHQGGPERPASILGQASYNAAASQQQEATRVTYGGWTPIYSASYASVQQQQYPASSDFTDGVQREPFLQDVVPQHVAEAEQELEVLPSSYSAVVSSNTQVAGEADAAAGQPDIPSSPSTLTQEGETAGIKKRTVRKRKSKQVLSSQSASSSRRRSSSLKRRAQRQQQQQQQEPAASNKDNAEVADLATAPASLISSPSPAAAEAPIVLVVAKPIEPLDSSRGQGRYIGRVLPATVFDEDDLNHMMIRLPTSRFHQPLDPSYY